MKNNNFSYPLPHTYISPILQKQTICDRILIFSYGYLPKYL